MITVLLTISLVLASALIVVGLLLVAALARADEERRQATRAVAEMARELATARADLHEMTEETTRPRPWAHPVLPATWRNDITALIDATREEPC